MGQTLTHGVYLPSEGERNCYSGLASNWRLLDGAIGTVAAHTTAIAGKADISHTHGNITNDGKVGTTANKPLITGTGGVVQAGSFGNAANTFCEGNDSRLSDARTPVAHTHTKSDVTDLLNSNFIPSANNSYDLGSSSYQWNNLYAKNYYYNGTEFQNKFVTLDTAQTISAIKTITGGNQGKMIFKNPNFTVGTTPEATTTVTRIYFGGSASYDSSTGIISNDITSNGYSVIEIGALNNNSSSSYRTSLILRYEQDQTRPRLIQSWGDFCPNYDNTYYLGRSDLQWKSVYAQSYYYNGTAWGLDKNNTWSSDNIYTYAITLKQTNLEEGVLPASNQSKRFRITDKNNANLGWLQHRINTSGDSSLEVYVVNKFSNGQLSTQGSEIGNALNLGLHSDGSRYCTVMGDVYPDIPTRVCNLGTSTNRWKTLNGINPGALSLPTLNYTNTSKYMDISGGLSTTGSDNWYTPAVDGWIFMIIRDSPTFANILVFVTPRGATPAQFIAGAGGVLEPSSNTLWCGCPAPAGSRVRIRIKNGTIEQAVFVTCQGNV